MFSQFRRVTRSGEIVKAPRVGSAVPVSASMYARRTATASAAGSSCSSA